MLGHLLHEKGRREKNLSGDEVEVCLNSPKSGQKTNFTRSFSF